MPLGGGQAPAYEVEFLFRRRDAAPRLLLEGVQDKDGALGAGRVDGAKGGERDTQSFGAIRPMEQSVLCSEMRTDIIAWLRALWR